MSTDNNTRCIISGGSDLICPVKSMKASNYVYPHYPANGNLAEEKPSSWRPSSNTQGQYLSLKLSRSTFITAIETKGDPTTGYYVTQFRVQYLKESSGDFLDYVVSVIHRIEYKYMTCIDYDNCVRFPSYLTCVLHEDECVSSLSCCL